MRGSNRLGYMPRGATKQIMIKKVQERSTLGNGAKVVATISQNSKHILQHVHPPRIARTLSNTNNLQIANSPPSPKGLDPMVKSEEFFTIGQGSIPVRA
jgi:hypothetical protein